jgi:putative tryptophan/tyrosine transport system substrate-binding protein
MTTSLRAVQSAFLLTCLTGAFCGCGGSGAGPGQGAGSPGVKVYRVGIASYAPDPGADRLVEGLLASLEQEGFARGRNLEVEEKNAAGEMATIPTMLQGLDSEGLDLVITLTTPVLANACQMVQKTPVVFCYVTDPIAGGAGRTFTDHLPHVTGVGSFDPVEETFDLLMKMVPNLKAVGTLYNASEANSTKMIAVARELARRKGFRLEEVTISATSDVLQAAQSLTMRDIQAIWITTDNTAAQAFAAIGMTAKKARLPLFANEKEQISNGALLVVGPSWKQVGEIAAKKAARVLRGEQPRDIPFEDFVGATVHLNNDLAKEMGIAFPPEIAALDGKNAPPVEPQR